LVSISTHSGRWASKTQRHPTKCPPRLARWREMHFVTVGVGLADEGLVSISTHSGRWASKTQRHPTKDPEKCSIPGPRGRGLFSRGFDLSIRHSGSAARRLARAWADSRSDFRTHWFMAACKLSTTQVFGLCVIMKLYKINNYLLDKQKTSVRICRRGEV
jgi:hypothetical protein